VKEGIFRDLKMWKQQQDTSAVCDMFPHARKKFADAGMPENRIDYILIKWVKFMYPEALATCHGIVEPELSKMHEGEKVSPSSELARLLLSFNSVGTSLARKSILRRPTLLMRNDEPATRRKVLAFSVATALTSQRASAFVDPEMAKNPKKKKPEAPEKEFVKTPSGAVYFDLKKGKGYSPNEGDYIVMKYKGYLSNGKIFDSSEAPGKGKFAAKYKATPSQMIKGWEEALDGMQEGGVRVVSLPPELGFGEKGLKDADGFVMVPPNEKLQYELNLIRVSLTPNL
jgi:peptidylprolyl isomerase